MRRPATSGSFSLEMSGSQTTNTSGTMTPALSGESSPADSLLPSGHDRNSRDASAPGRPFLYVGLLTAFSGIAGFLFGYDTGNISGALPFIQDEILGEYKSSTARLHWIEGMIVSAAIFGAAFGSAFGGALSDRLGRKAALKTADAFFILGAAVMATAGNASVLIMGRLLVGLGVGLASVTAPVYIAETAPTSVRASLVTVNTLMITTGQFAAYLLDYLFTFAPGTWRWMLGIAAAPAILQVVGMSFLPESPRWLISKGQLDEAHAALAKLRKAEQVEAELEEAASAAANLKLQRGSKALQAPEVRLELFVGVGLQVLQQICGINTVMYFLVSILSLAGISNNRTALLVAMGPAAVNTLGTIVGMVVIDRAGRRKLLLSSIAGVIIALLFLGTAFRLSELHTAPVASSTCSFEGVASCGSCTHHGCAFCSPVDSPNSAGVCVSSSQNCPGPRPQLRFDAGCPSRFLPLVICGVVAYLAAFSPGLGTVPWSVNAEIFPVEVRGLANGAAATANWITNAVVSQLFLTLADRIGASGVFWLLACIACLGALWTHIFLPETKGLSLDEVQELFIQRAAAPKRALPLPQVEED